AASVSTAAAFVILLVFALTGTTILDYLGISLASFQVSSGLLLTLTAVPMVQRGEPIHPSVVGTATPLGVALTPLATPLLAGLGAAATTVTFTNLLGRWATVAAVGCILALTAVVFVAAAWILDRFAGTLVPVLTRVVGILLTAIAVDLVLDGLHGVFA
ncbi:MAG: antibiotic resistance protein MarC, partial [Chloroflexota bacterium]